MKTSKRAMRSYRALAKESGRIQTLLVSDLKFIAKAINPDCDREHWLIFDNRQWGDGLAELTTLHAAFSDFRLRATLLFFRAQAAEWASTVMSNDIRMVFEVPRSEKDHRVVWLDCETGMPWRPCAVLQMRRHLNPEELRQAIDFDANVDRIARNALKELRDRRNAFSECGGSIERDAQRVTSAESRPVPAHAPISPLEVACV